MFAVGTASHQLYGVRQIRSVRHTHRKKVLHIPCAEIATLPVAGLDAVVKLLFVPKAQGHATVTAKVCLSSGKVNFKFTGKVFTELRTGPGRMPVGSCF